MSTIMRIGFILCLAGLVLLMGCGGKEEEAAAEPTAVPPTTAAKPTTPPKPAAAEPTAVPPTAAKPTAVPIKLGEEYVNEEGGFVYQTIPGYQVSTFGGLVNMLANGADPDVGPMVTIMGGLTGETTNEALYELLKSGTPMTVGAAEPIIVDGLPGLAADISGDNNGKAMQGRAALVMVTPTQQFTLLVGAPADRWEEVAPYFEGLLTAVTFIQPTTPEPISNLTPGNYAYVNSNVVRDLIVIGDTAYAATLGGMAAWDLTSGQGLLDGDPNPNTPRSYNATPLQGMGHVSANAVTTCKINGEPRVIVGTLAGLSLFDPFKGQWEAPPATPEESRVATSRIDRLFCDAANGRLLIGYSGLGVLDLASGEFVRYTTKEGLSWDGITDIVVNGRDIWVASGYNGLTQISDGQVTIHNAASGMPDERASALAAAPDGTLWVGGSKGLMQFKGGQWTLLNGLTDINEIELAPDGSIWLASASLTGGSLCRFDPQAGQCAVEYDDPAYQPILALALDAQGRPLYGTSKGVYLFAEAAGTAVPFVNEFDMLASNFVDSLAIAPDGKLWVGTDGGIQMLDPAFPDMIWQTYRKSDTPGLGGSWGKEIAFAPDGTVWVAITNGSASRFRDGVWQPIETVTSYDSVAVDADGRAWFGDEGKGIAVINADGSPAMKLTIAEGLPSDRVLALLADGETMWIALDSGLARYTNGQVEMVLDKNRLPHPYIRALALDEAGRLLIGANLSIVRYDGDQTEVLINFQQERYMDWLTTLAAAPNGRIWAGTANGLFYSDDGQSWSRMTTADGLLTNFISALLVDQYGTVWIGGGGSNFDGGGLLHIVP
ncbi:MAG: hypothetical protein H6667_03955 [Ardenticatenaceae bacterium]|nr:hypothetical protein [Ardenticatenaceae bacterium]MCB9446638.1 hypothetical protein [Ardenticatenaceae bacterium]